MTAGTFLTWQVDDALRDIAPMLPPRLADLAAASLANLETISRLAVDLAQANRAADDGAGGPGAGLGAGRVRVAPPDARGALRDPPPPPAEVVLFEASVPPASRSYRAIPTLCVQLQPWSPLRTRRRAACLLASTLRARSLDAEAALELLDRGEVTARLLALLQADESESSLAETLGAAGAAAPLETGGAGGVGGAIAAAIAVAGEGGAPPATPAPRSRGAPPSVRSSAPPSTGAPPTGGGGLSTAVAQLQPDRALRDACLACLALVAHIGGRELLSPAACAPPLCGALISAEPSTRLLAACFWRSACAYEGLAAALAKSIFSVASVRAAAIPFKGGGRRGGAYTNGIAVLRALALAAPPREGGDAAGAAAGAAAGVAAAEAVPADLAHAAACALCNLLRHESIRPLWTTAPDRLAYLVRLSSDEEQRWRAGPGPAPCPTPCPTPSATPCPTPSATPSATPSDVQPTERNGEPPLPAPGA